MRLLFSNIKNCQAASSHPSVIQGCVAREVLLASFDTLQQARLT
jgi:hypothetical protein